VPRDVPRGEVPDAVMPPLGCSFHPRCPRAFEVCGWESRDLRTLLEERWTKMSEPDYRAEREIIGDLDSLDAPSTSAHLAAAHGHTGAEVQEILERVRASAPDDPFWKGVAETRAEGSRVTVHFRDLLEPRDMEVGQSRVQCHLHDSEALALAATEAKRSG
jgi:peptide/nickel transport system ATP-binding protein